MPRNSRMHSISNVYHVIFKGNDGQDIFYEDEDRYAFLERLKLIKEKFEFEIYSYCLMSNHVHLVIKVKDNYLSSSMHNLGVRYSIYFNKKYNRTGHLFEERFFSKNVEDVNYLLEVCKYVHRNPEKANIQRTEDYKWSSFKEYVNKYESITNINVLLHYFNDDIESLIKYTLNNDDKKMLCRFANFELIKRLDEAEVNEIIKKRFDLNNASDISLMGQKEKDECIIELREMEGVSLNQLSRIIKVSRYYIKKCWNK